MKLDTERIEHEARRRAALACAQSNDWSNATYQGLVKQFEQDIIDAIQEGLDEQNKSTIQG